MLKFRSERPVHILGQKKGCSYVQFLRMYLSQMLLF